MKPITVLVEIVVTPTGAGTAEHIFRSSGNPLIDMAALRAARESSYAPRIISCVAVTGSYLFRARFDPDASPLPLSSPSGALACANPYVEAHVADLAQAVYPSEARDLRRQGVVLVAVEIGPTGALSSATVFRSSGFAPFDEAALLAARKSKYSPKLVNCHPVSSTYAFRVYFTPPQNTPSPAPK